MDYPNIWGYLRDLYQTSGFGDTTNRFHIEHHYQVLHDLCSLFPNVYSVDRGINLQEWIRD